MLFSSVTFIYYFLPILIMIYFVVPKKYKNFILLLFSLVFYFYGEKELVLILLFSCVFNYIMGIIIEKHHNKLLLIFDVLVNVSFLVYYKYFDFFISTINEIFDLNINLLYVIMPIGISFFTFQTMSYVIDVYKGEVKASRNFINFACYVTMFPQLVAGPIVRYKTIDNELINREHSFKNYNEGISRFIIGLGKKVIIANSLAQAISLISNVGESVVSLWTVAIFYTFQIYFDFSGYSDMAIGLGKMFGFHFLENFNYPFISKSIADFWSRWHISLSSWLKDYVYIPLGGNRKSKFKWFRNIFIVWFLTGLWHGASYNFILWGLFFAIFLVLEKFFLSNFLKKHIIFSYVYTFFIVIISFVIFNNTDINILLSNLKGMFFFRNIDFINSDIIYYLRSYFVLFIVSIIGSTPIMKNLYYRFMESKIYKKLWWIDLIILLLLIILVTSILINSSFNPFLYFRF